MHFYVSAMGFNDMLLRHACMCAVCKQSRLTNLARVCNAVYMMGLPSVQGIVASEWCAWNCD